MADRYFEQASDSVHECAQIGLAQIVSGIHPQSDGPGTARAVCTQRQRSAWIARGMRLGVRTGVQLDAVGADRRRLLDQRFAGIDEQADPAIERLQCTDVRLQRSVITGKIEAMVRRELAVAV